MSRSEKLLQRFLTIPNDFSYNELVRLLNDFGFYEQTTGKTSGSRVRFINQEIPDYPVFFHKPHPQKEVKEYVLRNVLTVLVECNLLKEHEKE
jgi:hypothetical protein